MPDSQDSAEDVIVLVEDARARLAAAAAGADLPGISQALDELERAYGLAAESGVAIPPPGPGSEAARA